MLGVSFYLYEFVNYIHEITMQHAEFLRRALVKTSCISFYGRAISLRLILPCTRIVGPSMVCSGLGSIGIPAV